MKKISLLVCVVVLLAVAFLVAPVAADKYLVTSNSYAPVAGAVVTISAQLSTDANVSITTAGNVVTWSNTGTGGSFAAVSNNTNEAGIATVTFTTSTTAGTVYTVTGTDAGSLTGTSAAITTVAGAATQIAENAGNGQSATVSTAVTTLPSVIVKDANNNPKSGASVIFAVASGGGSITNGTATTGSNGIATVGSWTLGPTGGSNTLTATSGTLTVTFTANGTAGSTLSYGSISVSSTPSGADVYLDNYYKGLTTLNMNNITNGNYIVKVRFNGYQDWIQNVTVLGNSASLTATLVANTTTPALNSTANGSIYVQSSPSSSKVFLNNVYQGYTPMTLYNITPGTPLVTVRRTDYTDWSQNVAVTAGNTTSVTASLVLAPEVTTATVTAPQTAATTVKITAKSTAKVPTPWPSATPTPASPVGILVILGAVGVGFVVIRKR